MKLGLAVAAILALGAPAAPAAAQDGWGWSIIVPSVTGTDQLGLHLREMRQQQSPAPSAQTRRADPSALRFVASPQRRTANFARFLDERRSTDPATFRQLQELLARPNLMAQIDTELRRSGLRADNVADAYAVWWIQAWQTVHGLSGEPSPAAIRAVQAQSERAFLASPGLLAAGDDAKQAFAEGLLIQAMILGAATEQLKDDPAELRRLADGVRRSIRGQSLDLGAMTLTDAGFVPAAS